MINQQRAMENKLPLVALIGPTNAGKSTLFNRLTGSWQAVTAKETSTTRDRVYGEVEWQGRRFTVVDTGGLTDDDSELHRLVKAQTLRAVVEADLILFVFDAREGIKPEERRFLKKLPREKTWLVANKVDSTKIEQVSQNFDFLGLPFYKVAAVTGRGVGDLLEDLTSKLSLSPTTNEKSSKPIIAIIGRPNVGKSTLLNTLVQKERAVVSSIGGTTRDVVEDELKLGEKEFILADTAGVRRRGRVGKGVEDFSVKRALQVINAASACLVLVDATIGTTRGDLHLIYYAHDLGKPVLVVFNKIDLVSEREKIVYHHHLARFDHALVSAKSAAGIDKVREWLIGLGKNKPTAS